MIYLFLSALCSIALVVAILATMSARTTRATAEQHRAQIDLMTHSHSREIDLLRSTHLEQMEALAQSSIQQQASANRMVAMAESAMREAEATARAATEQMAQTVERVTLTICRTVSPPPPQPSPDGNVTPEQRLADQPPWLGMLHPEEQRELELQRQRRALADRAQREAAPAAGWVTDQRGIQEQVLNGPPGDEAMAMAGDHLPMWGFDPSL